jgi:type II secretory pathway component PulF
MMEWTVEEIKNLGEQLVQRFKRWRFNNKAQLAFLEDLYLLINDGIPANRAIEMMSQVTTGLSRDVALSLADRIAQGQPLADGMQDWFAMNVIEIIRVGEAGGALGQTMRSAINTMAQRGTAISGFIGAVSYPLIVILMACAIISYLNTSVFTQFRAVKPIEEWPEAGRQLVAVANFIKNWWWIVILTVIGTAIVFRRLMTHYVGELRPWLDKVPPFSFYKRFVSAQLLETLGLLVANGVVFKSAIKVMQHQASPYLLSHLVVMEHLLSMGKTNIADVLGTGLVDGQDLMRLRVMAEVKGFEHGLIRMGVRGTELANKTMAAISRVAGGALLAVGGILIILIIRGIFLTGMSMGS